MRIGNYELRKPWVKYVEVPLEKQIYQAIRKSIGEDIAKDIEDLFDPPPIDEVDQIVWNVIEKCADIARGKND